jgi:5-methylcytosine-specific restriction protein A
VSTGKGRHPLDEKFYRSRAWRDRLRPQQLGREPLCADCIEKGFITKAETVDHVIPPYGDAKLQRNPDNDRSLCWSCHSRKTHKQHGRFGRPEIGPDGWPVEDVKRRWGYSIPHGLKPSGILVHLVCGAPGSGKSTFAREHAKPDDVVIDFDIIRQRLGFHRYSQDGAHVLAALKARDAMLRGLHQLKRGEVWLIVMAPTDTERARWCEALGNVTVHPLDTDARECARRVRADPERAGAVDSLLLAIDRYFIAREGTKKRRY